MLQRIKGILICALTLLAMAACNKKSAQLISHSDSYDSVTVIHRSVIDTVSFTPQMESAAIITDADSSTLSTSFAVSTAIILPDGKLQHRITNKDSPIKIPVVNRKDSVILRNSCSEFKSEQIKSKDYSTFIPIFALSILILLIVDFIRHK